MQTFAELLTEYMARTGISDTELARSIGVRRQTIFRWKEGLVARPRHRDDVLRCARRLRLTPEERDALLVAAGFPPEEAPIVPSPTAPVAQPPQVLPAPVVETTMPWAREPVRRRSRLRWVVFAVAVLVVGGALLAAIRWGRGPSFPVAGEGETLVVVGRFMNYAGGQQGYNVAGRVRDVLAGEIEEAGLADVRVVVWPEELPNEAAAQAAGRRSGARIVIWGEYDSGRVVARLATPGTGPGPDKPKLKELVTTPAGLTATINSDLPKEVRYLGLLTLGQLYEEDGDFDQARAVLAQALVRPPAESDALATLYFRLGYVHQKRNPPDLDQAVRFYSQAVSLEPGLVSGYNNRGIAYLRRGEAGDLGRAIEDLTQAVVGMADDASVVNNRGAAYLQRDGPGDLARAVKDFSRAVELAPDAPEAYFNRGLAYIRQGKRDLWLSDLEQALALNPDEAGVYNALCWAYALDQEPDQALSFCDKAVALDPTGFSQDSRGVVYAELGRYAEAARDFEVFLNWLRQQPTREYERYGPRREAWLDALRAGRNPFDAATLEELRRE
jgi:tetratricopeptide (TPR) repeat protein